MPFARPGGPGLEKICSALKSGKIEAIPGISAAPLTESSGSGQSIIVVTAEIVTPPKYPEIGLSTWRPPLPMLRRLLENGPKQRNLAKALKRVSVLLALYRQHRSRDSEKPEIRARYTVPTYPYGRLGRHNRVPRRLSLEPPVEMGPESAG